ncbi:MAG: glycosyltransferase family 2 protein, partial [Gammaproteobacteria bacterium]|nr:glycosyltransferase family 2 protein [Gammaproteobacteria bacterium]
MDDSVSVIIPTYNRSYCICRAVDSALAQTHGDVEVFIVDDGSSDDTQHVIEEHYANDPRVHYYFQENRGVSAARNLALSYVTSRYVAFLDSDDYWKPWKLALQLCCIKQLDNVGMVWTNMEGMNENGEVFDKKYMTHMCAAYQWHTLDELFSQSHTIAELFTPLSAHDGDSVPDSAKKERVYSGSIYPEIVLGDLILPSTILIKREILEAIGGFKESYKVNEDFEFHVRVCRHGRVAFIDSATTYYQAGHSDRLSETKRQIYFSLNNLKTIKPILAEEKNIDLPQQQIDRVFAKSYAWIGYYLLKDHKKNRTARKFLAASLRLRPWQKRTFLL